MLNKRNVKIIKGVEHQGNIPAQQGKLLWFVDKCPWWSTIIMIFGLIIIEMLGFACLYCVMSSSSFDKSLNYSLFSVLGETVDTSVRNSLIINRIISFQLILTNCIISFFMAVVLYKLINTKPILIKMENHVVFDPTTGTLRLRVANVSRFDITNAHIDAVFRIHVPESNRHANARLKLKTDNMIVLKPYDAWNIATKPFLPDPEKGESAQLDFKRYDSDRIYEFIPDLLSPKYRSDNKKEAESRNYRNLTVTITIKSPLFGTDWVYHKSFNTIDFVCGKLKSVEPEISDKEIKDWNQWEKYTDLSEYYCEKCAFQKYCGIIKTSQKHTTIN